VGMFKKVVMADLLAVHLVDRVFDLPARFSSLEVLAATYGYAFQIYFDFSGYTDIAIGSAMLLGFRLPANFDAPYRASSLRDFWRRWHISLSSWLRDYLYIPLGGSRRGRVAVTLFLTMLLGGLWHGAAWTFVLWGAMHGVGLIVHRAWLTWRRGRTVAPETATTEGAPGSFQRSHTRSLAGIAWRIFATLITFHFVTAAWVLFRSETLSAAGDVFAQLLAFLPGHANLSPVILALLSGAVALHLLPRHWERGLTDLFVRLPSPLQALVMVTAAWGITQLASGTPTPFVYFQF
jgi:alginate O-acetyltransferase complex protein AlgI